MKKAPAGAFLLVGGSTLEEAVEVFDLDGAIGLPLYGMADL